MSDVTICDKCGKPIDKSKPYFQVVATEVVEEDGTPTVVTAAVQHDYHPDHLPKLEKAEPPEPEPEPEPEEPAP